MASFTVFNRHALCMRGRGLMRSVFICSSVSSLFRRCDFSSRKSVIQHCWNRSVFFSFDRSDFRELIVISMFIDHSSVVRSCVSFSAAFRVNSARLSSSSSSNFVLSLFRLQPASFANALK